MKHYSGYKWVSIAFRRLGQVAPVYRARTGPWERRCASPLPFGVWARWPPTRPHMGPGRPSGGLHCLSASGPGGPFTEFAVARLASRAVSIAFRRLGQVAPNRTPPGGHPHQARVSIAFRRLGQVAPDQEAVARALWNAGSPLPFGVWARWPCGFITCVVARAQWGCRSGVGRWGWHGS